MATTPEADKTVHETDREQSAGTGSGTNSGHPAEMQNHAGAERGQDAAHDVRPSSSGPDANRQRSAGPPSRPQTGPPPPSRGQQIHTWTTHPLLLLVIGALMTGIIVPSITGKWQRNQTAQDMKTQVIGDATSALSIPLTELSVTRNPVLSGGNAPQTAPGTVASTYGSFLTKSDSVDSEIKAYFPEDGIPTHWQNLVGLMQNFYLLTYTNNFHLKQSHLQQIEQYFQAHHASGGTNWNLLLHGTWNVPGFYRSWLALENKIKGVKSIVLDGIMNAPAPSF